MYINEWLYSLFVMKINDMRMEHVARPSVTQLHQLSRNN